MPLLPLEESGEVAIEIDGDIYYVAEQYGIADVQQLNRLRTRIATATMRYSAAIKAEPIEAAMSIWEDMQKARRQLLKAALRRWSHSESISIETIQRVPDKHQNEIVRGVSEILDGKNRGVDLDSDTGKP